MPYTATAYRRHLAQALGVSGTHTMTAVATGPYQLRSAIAASQTGLVPTWRTSMADRGSLVGYWLYVASGGAQDGTQARIMAEDRENGVLTVDKPWAGNLSTSSVVDLAPLPVFSQGGVIGLFELLNMALDDIGIKDFLPLSSVASQFSYSISTTTYPWFTRANLVLNEDGLPTIYDPGLATGYPPMPSWRRWRVDIDGPTVNARMLDGAYPASGFSPLIQVKDRPAKTFISNTDSTTGLVLELSTAIPEPAVVTTVALLHAYRWLARAGDVMGLSDEERERCRQMAAEQEPKVLALRDYLPRTTTTEAAA